jgi:hypothetical protein
VTAATTVLKPNIGFPRLSNAGILVPSRNPSQPAFPNSFLTVAKRLYLMAGHRFGECQIEPKGLISTTMLQCEISIAQRIWGISAIGSVCAGPRAC